MAKVILDFYDAQDADFYVHAVDDYEQMPASEVHRPDPHLQWLIIYFHDPVEIHYQGRVLTNKQSALFIWPPHAAHHLGNAQSRWAHSWMHISGKMVDAWMQQYQIPIGEFIYSLHKSDHELFFRQCVRELAEYIEPQQHILQNLFQNWLLRLQRSLSPVARLDDRMLQLRRYIDKAFRDPLTLRTLAQEVNMSASHMSALFKESFEMSPMAYVLTKRLEEARYLLGNHMLRINEIALRVGYSDEFHFSRLFKKHYGMSPKAYRSK